MYDSWNNYFSKQKPKRNKEPVQTQLFNKINENEKELFEKLPKAFSKSDIFSLSAIGQNNEFEPNNKIKRVTYPDRQLLVQVPGNETLTEYSEWEADGQITLPNKSVRNKNKTGKIVISNDYILNPPVYYEARRGKYHLENGTTRNKLRVDKNLKKPLMDMSWFDDGSIRLPSGYSINPSTYANDSLIGLPLYADTILRPDGIIETLDGKEYIISSKIECPNEFGYRDFCEKTKFNFAFFGCWNMRTASSARDRVVEAIRTNRDKDKISFGVLGGDNYYSDNRRSLDLATGDFDESDADDDLLEGFHMINSLNLFFMGVLGNHDKDTQEQQLKLYKRLPNVHIYNFKSVDIYNTRFILLNSNVVFDLQKKESTKRENTLYLYSEIVDQMLAGKHNIIVLHHPIVGYYTGNKKDNIQLAALPLYVEFIEKIFKKVYHGYRVSVLSSDIHTYQKIKIAKPSHPDIFFYQYVVGTGGAKPDSMAHLKYVIQNSTLGTNDRVSLKLEDVQDAYGYLLVSIQNICSTKEIACKYEKVSVVEPRKEKK
jgi:hypothetical protein